MAYIGNAPAAGVISGDNIQDGSVQTADLANGAVTAAKMASGAAASNLGYTPANKAGDTISGNVVLSTGVAAGTNLAVNAPLLEFKGSGWDFQSGAKDVGMRLTPDYTYWNVAGSNSPYGRTYPDLVVQGLRSDSSSYVELLRFTGLGDLKVTRGIAFPATQNASSDANTLDDYEEGTWSPSAAITYLSGSITTTYSAGRYTKIGNQVTCWFQLVFNLTWSGTQGNVGISGLPFAPSSITNTGGCFGTARRQDSEGTMYQIESVNTSATISVLRRYDNGGFGSATGLNFAGFFTYTV